jgi:uncharacterized protein (TIRG00374 family)
LNKNIKTGIQTIVFLTIGIVLFYYAIGDASIGEEIQKANWFWIGVSLVCGVLSHLARALRWNLLLEPMGYKVSSWASFHAVILGYLVNLVLPRVGEITRPAVLSKIEGIPFNKLVGTVVVERVVDLLITLLIAISIFFIQFSIIQEFVTDLFANSGQNQFIWYVIAGILLLLSTYLVYRNRKWFYQLPIINKFQSFIEGLLDGMKTVFSLNRKGLFIFYSLFIWLMYFFMPFFIFYALEGTSHLGVSAGLTVLLFGTAAMIIPIPGGVGTFEYLVPAALALYGITNNIATSYAIITHAIQFLVIIGVGAFSIIYFIWKNQQIKKNVETEN